MFTKFPKDTNAIRWTRHIKNKMMFYGLSESKIRRVLQSPKRKEEGIAPHTVAAMQPNHKTKRKEEIWVMYQKLTNNKQQITKNNKSKASGQSLVASGAQVLLISAWRYPGVTKPGAKVPIPDDILAELENLEGISKM